MILMNASMGSFKEESHSSLFDRRSKTIKAIKHKHKLADFMGFAHITILRHYYALSKMQSCGGRDSRFYRLWLEAPEARKSEEIIFRKRSDLT